MLMRLVSTFVLCLKILWHTNMKLAHQAVSSTRSGFLPYCCLLYTSVLTSFLLLIFFLTVLYEDNYRYLWVYLWTWHNLKLLRLLPFSTRTVYCSIISCKPLEYKSKNKMRRLVSIVENQNKITRCTDDRGNHFIKVVALKNNYMSLSTCLLYTSRCV